MANIYVRSTTGSDANNGTTWALAKATINGAMQIAAANDVVYVSQVHAETQAAFYNISAWPSNSGTPSVNPIFCGNDAAQPPTAAATTATVTTTGTSSISIGSGCASWYGITFSAGTSTGTINLNVHSDNTNALRYTSCNFVIGTTSISSRIVITSILPTYLTSCGFKFANASQTVNVFGPIFVRGGSLLAGGTSPSVFFTCTSSSGELDVDGFDFSNASASLNLCSIPTTLNYKAVFRDCKLPTSWSGAPSNATLGPGGIVEMRNCAAGAVNYAYWKRSWCGDVKHETTKVRSGGANDGTTTYSLQMASNSNAKFGLSALESPDLIAWVDTTGSPLTATVEILTDSVGGLTNQDIWLEIMVLQSSATPLGAVLSSGVASFVATPATLPASTATWTTTGMTHPNKQKLQVTFTPQMKGFIVAKVVLTNGSVTPYIDPMLTVA